MTAMEKDMSFTVPSYSVGDRLKVFINAVGPLDLSKDESYDFILSLLPHASLYEGYMLSSFRYGCDDYGYEFIPYIHKCTATTEWYPPMKSVVDETESCAYNDDCLISGIWGYGRDIASVPSILGYFKFSILPECVLDAWILNNLRNLFPKFWHANYGARYFICGTESLASLFPDTVGLYDFFANDRIAVKDAVFALDTETLMPRVTVCGNKAVFTCSYWNQFSGLYSMETVFRFDDGNMNVVSCDEKRLVEHVSSIRF